MCSIGSLLESCVPLALTSVPLTLAPRALAAKREAERVKREGSDAFVAQRAAGDGDSSNVRKVDASRDYYATLGVDR